MRAPRDRPRTARRTGALLTLVLLAGILAYALPRLGPGRVADALVSAGPGWLLLAFALMALSLLLRAISWRQVLRAALPRTPIGRLAVLRATMIGVMGSAVFPGRIGEPARVVVLSRRLEGSTARLAPVIAGTVFSQTLINILALAILGAVTFTSVPVFHDHLLAAIIALAIPLAALLLMLAAPRLLRYARRWPSLRVMAVANTLAAVLRLVRDGLLVFTRPRHGIPAVAAQLLAWALQWLACYAVLLALGLQGQAGPVAAAAILLAINLSAVLPVTPSNVGLFQAACLVVLAAFGVAPGPALAYGLVLQAVEVLTALGLGVPALLREGMRWGDIRASAHAEEEPQA